MVRPAADRGVGVARRLNLIGPAFEQPEYSLLAREKVCRPPHACVWLCLRLTNSPSHNWVIPYPMVSGPHEPLYRTNLVPWQSLTSHEARLR